MEIRQDLNRTSMLNRLNYFFNDGIINHISFSNFRSLETGLDGMLERHQKMQEEVAEDMVKLARSLKQNAVVAKKIIQDDNKVGDVVNIMKP